MALNYKPISSESDLKSALKQIDSNFRQIAAENQTKTISQGGGTALRYGLLENSTYGFVLNDPSNRPRIEIGFNDVGEPHIFLNDTNGKPRLQLDFDSKGNPRISLCNVKGRRQITLGDNTNGQSNIVLNDTNNVPRILIGFHANGDPIMAVTKAGINVLEAIN